MKRIATTVAIAALAIGASATTASARPCVCDDSDTSSTVILASVIPLHPAITPAKKAKHPAKKSIKKTDSRPVHVVYLGRH